MSTQAVQGYQQQAGASCQIFALTAMTSLFFLWGFITVLNDILIPHLKVIFALNYAQAMLVQFAFFGAYFVVSLPAGMLAQKFGYKSGIVTGLLVMSVGAFGFYPAAALVSYPVFLAALFVLAAGITILQVSANPYVTALGTPERASSRLTFAQAINSLGTTIGPYVGALFILSETTRTAAQISAMSVAEQDAYRLAEAVLVQNPYLGIAIILLLTAACFAWLKLPIIKTHQPKEPATQKIFNHPAPNQTTSALKSWWQYPHLVLGAIGIFVYVGAEVSIGSFLVSFLMQPEIGNMLDVQAGKLVSVYWGGAMIGTICWSGIIVSSRSWTLIECFFCWCSRVNCNDDVFKWYGCHGCYIEYWFI